MPLITKHSEGTVIAQLPDFSCVCGIHYIWLHLVQMEKQNH